MSIVGFASLLSSPWVSLYLHPVPIFLCHPFLTMRSMSLFVCDFFPHFLSSVFLLPPLSVTFMLSQTYDDIDLENEPWYKFFSELEFGRPVSQGRSCSLNHNPVIGIHPLSPPHPWFFYVSTNRLGGASCLGMWYLLGAVTPPPSPHPFDRRCYVSVLLGFLVRWLAGTVMFIHQLFVLKLVHYCILSLKAVCSRCFWWLEFQAGRTAQNSLINQNTDKYPNRWVS